MPALPSVKAKRLLAALLKLGFTVVRMRGSHRFLRHADGRTMVFAFHAGETVGSKMLSRVIKDAKVTVEAYLAVL